MRKGARGRIWAGASVWESRATLLRNGTAGKVQGKMHNDFDKRDVLHTGRYVTVRSDDEVSGAFKVTSGVKLSGRATHVTD